MRNLNFILLILCAVSASGQTPTVSASKIIFTFVGCNELTVQWTNGNGSDRLVFIREGGSVNDVPVLHNYYTDDPIYSKGESIKGDKQNFCVYNGPNNKVTVKGLKKMTRYYFAVFEYNGGGAIYDYKTDAYPVRDATTNNIVASFIRDTARCLNDNSFKYTNTSYSDLSPLTYIWKFADGDSMFIKDAQHSYITPGIKKVILIANAPGCYNSTWINDSVYPHPIASFTLDPFKPKNDSIQCYYGNRFTFQNKTTLLDIGDGPASMRYEWFENNNRPLFSSGYKADHRFSLSGYNTIKLVVITNRGCMDSTIHTYKVLPRAMDVTKISISPKTMYLKNNQFTFTNNGMSFPAQKWRLARKKDTSFEDSLTGNTVNYTFNSIGIYYIYLETIDTITNCFDVYKDSVEVKQNVGTSLINRPTVSIYPNPSKSGLFNIDNIPGDAFIKVYSIIGEELLSINPHKSSDQINLTGFGAGTYILSIWSEGRKFDYRLVVL